MKKIISFCVLGSLILLFSLFNSCKEEPIPDDTTTVAEDRQNIQLTFDNSLVGVNQIKDGSFFQAVMMFFDLQNGDALNETWINKLDDELNNVANYDWLEDHNRFSFGYYGGTYNWNLSTQTWDKTQNSQVVINFPSEPFITSNNCTFRITDYSDAIFTINDEAIYIPTMVKASLTKDGVEIFNIDFSATYVSSGFPVPVHATISLMLKPFNYSIEINKLTNTQFEITANLLIGAEHHTKLYSKVSLANDDYESLDIEEDINTVQFDYEKGDINVNGSWDIQSYNNLFYPSADDINGTIYCIVNYKQKKIGELRFKDVGAEQSLFIYYKDGTSENTSIFYDPFINEFKALLTPYFGDMFW
jgi:hypothetical protein